MFQVIAFAGPTTFYVAGEFETLDAAISVMAQQPIGYGLQIEENGAVVLAIPGPPY